jgi:hypothetical protein
MTIMKIITTYLFTTVVMLLSLQTNAQQAYFKLHGEYAYGLNQSTQHYLNPLPGLPQEEIEPYTYGDGTSFGLSAGYMISDKFGLDMGLSCHLSSEFEFETESITHHARMLNITPGIVLTPGYDTFNPYARTGIVLGFGKIIAESEQDDFYSAEEFTGGLAIGLNGAFGVEYKISENFQVFAETSVTSLSWAPEKAEYVTYERDGIDYLPIMTTSQKEVEFVEEYDQEYGMDDHSDEPETRLKYNYSFSNVGLTLGLKILL